MHFRPCIDLHGGKVKQIIGSTLTDRPADTPQTNFETDLPSSHYAELYKRDGLSGGHVIMLGGGNEGTAIEALAAYPGGLQIGGGIGPDNAAKYLDAGASHVIATSYVFRHGSILLENLLKLEKAVGKNRLVVDVSCKKTDGSYIIVSDRWQTLTGVVLSAEVLGRLAEHCDEFLVHAVDVEGKQHGIDPAIIDILARKSPITATYAGGVRSLADLDEVRISGLGRVDVTIGSALDIFGGPLEYAKVLAWFRSHPSGTK